MFHYIGWKVRKDKLDFNTKLALEKWAATFVAKARVKLQEAAVLQRPLPDGYPGLRDQIKAAQNALVFGPEDRAPHALFYACGRLYASLLEYRLQDSGAFKQETRSREEVLEDLSQFNKDLQLNHHNRLPYLYGAWKAKKQAFRWIAGTSTVQDDERAAEEVRKENEAPKNAMSEAGKVLVKVAQHILKALRAKDIERRGRALPARYWVVEDIDEFVQEFRANASEIAKHPWATYDFTTMCEALQHDRLIEGCSAAASEAWEYMEARWALQEGLSRADAKLSLGSTGWMLTRDIDPESLNSGLTQTPSRRHCSSC